jgi:predicted nucleic acid-binding protein
MTIPRIYLETTMFNFPFADDAPQYRADTLKLFEEIKAGKFEPYTSIYVTDELQADPDQAKRERMLRLIGKYNIKVFGKDEKAERLAEIYIREGAIKATYPTDAVHIATAAVNELDFIVSLNFQHIVKRKTIEATARINSREGYRQIGIYQPSEVINDDDENS